MEAKYPNNSFVMIGDVSKQYGRNNLPSNCPAKILHSFKIGIESYPGIYRIAYTLEVFTLRHNWQPYDFYFEEEFSPVEMTREDCENWTKVTDRLNDKKKDERIEDWQLQMQQGVLQQNLAAQQQMNAQFYFYQNGQAPQAIIQQNPFINLWATTRK